MTERAKLAQDFHNQGYKLRAGGGLRVLRSGWSG